MMWDGLGVPRETISAPLLTKAWSLNLPAQGADPALAKPWAVVLPEAPKGGNIFDPTGAAGLDARLATAR